MFNAFRLKSQAFQLLFSTLVLPHQLHIMFFCQSGQFGKCMLLEGGGFETQIWS